MSGRRTFAVRLNNNIDLKHIKVLLGLKTLQATKALIDADPVQVNSQENAMSSRAPILTDSDHRNLDSFLRAILDDCLKGASISFFRRPVITGLWPTSISRKL